MSCHEEFLHSLENGTRRAAHYIDGKWVPDSTVKQHILDIFHQCDVVDMENGFCDKSLLVPRTFSAQKEVRVVPSGSTIRPGTYIGKRVVIMAPSYVNIGAYIDDDVMVDHHVLVGSCAQIGKRVHLAAGVQICGVLEPTGHRPVIIEDDCFVGAGSIIMGGFLVQKGAVIAAGVTLSPSIPVYDVVHQQQYTGFVPENAVVVSGSRPMKNNAWAQQEQLHIYCALIVKYRDEKTNGALALEEALR